LVPKTRLAFGNGQNCDTQNEFCLQKAPEMWYPKRVLPSESIKNVVPKTRLG